MKIEDIPTEIFNGIIKSHVKSGWKNIDEYKGFDAWIDYGKVVLSNGKSQLVFEWDNWSEGWVEGPEEYLDEINKAISDAKHTRQIHSDGK
ncbi:MAG: DUF3450 domain-containing protein [Gammaproteobacteria bacterium]|nr:DUF3450 domain-containing protein [Gammaproteobacteria bacterium]